ncbi:MAG: DUF3618 domain-containing protein [Thermoleophilia bacterium]|nr:DUF3618 domain-containing protein [Thermoleophilia bacterium]
MTDKPESEPFKRPPGSSPASPGDGPSSGSRPAGTPGPDSPAARPESAGLAHKGHPGAPAGAAAPGPKRTSAQIRADIDNQREQLGQSVDHLRDRVNDLTDWRGQIRKHRKKIVVGAVAAGFVAGGLMALRRR